MTKKIIQQPVVLTTQNTGVSQILDELMEALEKNDNLHLEAPKLKEEDEE